jgi:hypothetical protein
MTLFFGSRDRYMQYFQDHPGTYFLTSGWIERGEASGDLRQLSIQNRNGMDMTLEQLVAKYGEENGRYLYNELCDQTKHYRQITYIEMGIEPDDRFRRTAEERAREHGWQFDAARGEMPLIEHLVNGAWDDKDFLVVPPGHRIVVTYDDRIIRAEPVTA